MLLCLRGKAFPILTQLCKEATPVSRQCLSASVAIRCYRSPLASPVLRLSAYNSSARLHTSSQWQKKKKEESELQIKLDYHWQEIKKTPKPAFILACAGAVPFVIAPLAMSLTNSYYPELATAQILHGACVLSFLGGIRWGFTLPEDSLAKPNWGNLLTGVLYPYMAIICLLWKDDVDTALLGLGMGFLFSLIVDVTGIKDLDLSPISPVWYRWLRALLTVVALVSFIATLNCSSHNPKAKIPREERLGIDSEDEGSR